MTKASYAKEIASALTSELTVGGLANIEKWCRQHASPQVNGKYPVMVPASWRIRRRVYRAAKRLGIEIVRVSK